MNAKFQPKKPYVKPPLEKPMTEQVSTPAEEIVNETPVETTPVEPVVESPVVEKVEAPAPKEEVVQTPAPAPTPAPVAQAPVVKNTVVAPKPISSEPTIESLFETMRQSGTVYEKSVMASLDAYREKMAPGIPVNPDDGARQQYNLWKLFETVVESAPEQEFKKLWSVMLAYINGNISGVFNDRYVYRFADQWVWGLGELNAFQRLLNLAITTSNPATRQIDIRRVSVAKTLAEGFSEKAKERLNNYYQS